MVCVLISLLIISQVAMAARKDSPLPTTTPTAVAPTATAKITKFLDDMTDFLTDVLYSISNFIGLGEAEEKSPSGSTISAAADYDDYDEDGNLIDKTENNTKVANSWSLRNLMAYTMGALRSGYKMVRDSIPVLQVARESVESVSLIMPNVSLATLVEHVLMHVTPELMKPDE